MVMLASLLAILTSLYLTSRVKIGGFAGLSTLCCGHWMNAGLESNNYFDTLVDDVSQSMTGRKTAPENLGAGRECAGAVIGSGYCRRDVPL